MRGMPSGFAKLKVKTARVKRIPGDRGVLIVTLAGPLDDSRKPEGWDFADDYDLLWERIEKPIETHPRYSKGLNLNGGPAGLEPTKGLGALYHKNDKITYFDKVAEYFSETDPEKKAAIITDLAGYPLALELITKKKAGIDSWITFAPVVKVTQTKDSPPTAKRCAVRVFSLPVKGFKSPPGYQWLLTADQWTKNNKTRVREYTGGEIVDPELYPVGQP
jgi:hypothetical protein